MKQAILLLTNRTDYAVYDKYKKMLRDYGKRADVFLLFDTSKSVDYPITECFENIYTFNVSELIHEGYTALENGFLGNCHYPLLKFRKDYSEYEYYWLVEDDVMFSGDWSVLFDAFICDKSDLLTTKIRNYADEPEWYWWRSIKAPKDTFLSENDLFASFNPIYRLSFKALDCLEIEMHKGWRGHFEAIVPTIVAMYGLTMRDMGGEGRFVKRGTENKFYTHDTHTWTPLRVQKIIPNMIYHPIKEKVSKRTYKSNCLISIVGEHSNHMQWIAEEVERNFDVHLIVNDQSFNKHYESVDYLYGKTGCTIDLIKDYFNSHEYLLNQYNYFFLIDEMSSMRTSQINFLFDKMKKDSNVFSLVGMSMPCFCQDLIKQLLNKDPQKSTIYF